MVYSKNFGDTMPQRGTVSPRRVEKIKTILKMSMHRRLPAAAAEPYAVKRKSYSNHSDAEHAEYEVSKIGRCHLVFLLFNVFADGRCKQR